MSASTPADEPAAVPAPAPERLPVSTTITFEVDYGEPEDPADQWGMPLGCTAADVLASLRTSVDRSRAVQDWDILNVDPDLRIHVYTEYSDGTGESSHAEWSWQTDRDERAAAAAAAPPDPQAP